MPYPTQAMNRRGGSTTSPSPVDGQSPRRKLGDIRWDSFFTYAVNLVYTTGIEALPFTIPVQSDAHFMCVESIYDVALTTPVAVAAVAIGVVPQLASGGVLIQLTDGGTQRAMSNIQIPVSTLFGTAQRPFVWPFTHVFKANTSIQGLATGVAAAVMALTTVRLTFSGFKIPINTMPEMGL